MPRTGWRQTSRPKGTRMPKWMQRLKRLRNEIKSEAEDIQSDIPNSKPRDRESMEGYVMAMYACIDYLDDFLEQEHIESWE